MAATLVRVNEVLDAFTREASKLAEAKSAALKKEAEALESILKRLLTGVLYCDMLYLEKNELILIDKSQEIPMGENRGIKVSNRLILSVDKVALVRRFGVEQWGTGTAFFEFADEQEMSCVEAVKSFGLDAICVGLMDQLKCQPPGDVITSEYQERIERADKLLAATQQDEGGENVEIIEA